jgi:hypothetical protein
MMTGKVLVQLLSALDQNNEVCGGCTCQLPGGLCLDGVSCSCHRLRMIRAGTQLCPAVVDAGGCM